MEIKAKVALSLPNKFYKIILKYDTFEKATYDSYLIASLVANTNNDDDAIKYIDDITGNGSLNPHFKKLYGEISKLSKEQIDGILTDSLFPVTVINKSHHFKYYEMFDATRMDNMVYPHNLKDDPKLADMIMPKNQNAKFLSMDFEEEEGTIKSNVYNAIFSENGIQIDLDGGHYYPISADNFYSVYKNDIERINRYEGEIRKEITSGDWNVLNNQVLNAICNMKQFYIDEDGNHCSVLTDCLKKTEIINVFSLYFYKETKYDYSIKNSAKCEEVVDYLLKSKYINEFKTKSLINILSAVSDKTSQKVVQYILGRKDSKEISEIGIRLIKDGLEKGWELDVLKSIKKVSPKSEYKYLYRLNSNLDFEIEDLLNIDDADLTQKDLKKKHNYLSKRENIINDMNLMVGEIMNSGVREKMKSLKTKDSVYKTLNDFIKECSAHLKEDYESMSLEKLTNRYNNIKSVYVGAFEKIKKRLSKKEEVA